MKKIRPGINSGLIFFYPNNDITSCFRSTRRILSVSCGPWLYVMQVPCGRLLWPFFHGNRACSFSSCWKAGMFFSSLYIFIVSVLIRESEGKGSLFFPNMQIASLFLSKVLSICPITLLLQIETI